MSVVGTEKRTPSFRRRAVAVRRRRAHPLIAVGVPLMRLGLLALPAVALGAWLLTAPGFGLEEVAVTGAERVGENWVRESLAPLEGVNLVTLPLEEVRRRLAPNPWIRAVALHKELPSRLRVEVVEHRPAALLRQGDTLLYLSQEGAVITPFTAPDDRPFLVVEYVGGSWEEAGRAAGRRARPELERALGVARELDTSDSPWAGQLSRIEILGLEDYRLWLDSLSFPILVRPKTAEPKILLFERLLPQILRRYPQVQSVDLRFSNRIVLKPVIDSRSPRADAGAFPAATPTGT